MKPLRISFLIICASLLISIKSTSTQAQNAVTNWSIPIDISDGATSNWRTFGAPVCDPYQNMHIFWADNAESGAAIFYRNDIDNIWSTPVDILAVPYPSIYYLAATVSNQHDTIHLAWVANAPGTLYHTKTKIQIAQHAKGWPPPQVLDTGVYNPAIAVDSNGSVHIVYAASDDGGLQYAVFHIKSDDGEIWSFPRTIYSRQFSQPFTIRTEMAIDDADRLHVGLTPRSQEYGDSSEVGYLRSLDGGLTWSEYHVVDDTSETFQGVAWIAPYTFGENEVHLTWHDPRRMHQWSYDGGETWSDPIEIMPLGGAFGGANYLAKDSAGIIHVVTAVLTSVFSGEWNGMDWGPPEVVDDRDIDAHGQQLVVCQGNQLHLTYTARILDPTVWYTTKTVAAPHISRQPIPDLVSATASESPISTNSLPEQNQPTPDMNKPTAPTDEWMSGDPGNTLIGSPVKVLFLGLAPAAAFIAAYFIVRQIRARQP